MTTVEALIEHMRVLVPAARDVSRKVAYQDEQFHKKFMKNGFMDNEQFRLLGSGAFGITWEHLPTGLAVKIGGFLHYTEDTYPTYAKFCMEHPELPHLPKIMHIEHSGEHDYFVIMPLYYHNCDNLDDSTRYFMRDIVNNGKVDKGLEMLVPEQLRASLTEVCMALHPLAEEGNVDLHAGNIMLDKDGALVITDPFSYLKPKTPAPKQKELAVIGVQVKPAENPVMWPELGWFNWNAQPNQVAKEKVELVVRATPPKDKKVANIFQFKNLPTFPESRPFIKLHHYFVEDIVPRCNDG